jgi:hypothetical protein
MSKAIDWLARAVAGAGCLGALATGSPAGHAASWQQAQATPAPGTSSQAPGAPSAVASNPHGPTGPLGPTALSESRINDLRTKLQITPAEEPRFNALADVMRANAQAMEALLDEREKDTDQTAVGELRWYERLTDAHADSLKKFVPAFAALYGTLSDSQKKTADTMFQQFAQRSLPQKH